MKLPKMASLAICSRDGEAITTIATYNCTDSHKVHVPDRRLHYGIINGVYSR